MPTVAKTAPGTSISYGEHIFEFGEDGTRQVSEAERQALQQYIDNGGPARIEFEESKPKKGR